MKNQKTNEQYQVYEYQVSGKAAKFMSADGEKLLKSLSINQRNFYQQITQGSNLYAIEKYLPKYYGVVKLDHQPTNDQEKYKDNKDMREWLNHLKDRYPVRDQNNQFISLSNMLNGYKYPNIIDIKIGNRNEKPEKITPSVAKYCIKLNGIQKNSKDVKQQFRSKYGLNKIFEEQQILQNLAYFLQIDGVVETKLLQKFIQQLKDLVLCIRSLEGWNFVSSSICMFYDAADLTNSRIAFIDFGRAQLNGKPGSFDLDASHGIENVIQFLNKISKKKSNFDNKTPQKDSINIPDKKIKKFQKKASGNNS